MNIALVWKNDYPWDVRVEKIAKTLLSFGHDVHIIASNEKKRETYEVAGGLKIHRLKPIQNNRLNKLLSIPTLPNLRWQHFITEVCVKNGINLIIVRDLPLLLNGIQVAKKLRIPIIFDMAENYPALWDEVNKQNRFNLSNFFLKNPVLCKHMEKYAVTRVDHVLVVVQEAMDYLVKNGLDKKMISIVSNTPYLNGLEKLTKASSSDGVFTILYQGYINEGRGLRVAVRAMPALLKKYGRVRLQLAGTGDDLGNLKSMAAELKISQHVDFKGWVEHSTVQSLIYSSDLCIIPHLATEHKNTTVPNKLFDYMSYSKPIVVSDAKPLKRIVNEENCGLVFRSGDVESYTEAISRFIENPELAIEMGAAGKKAFLGKYNWKNDSLILKGVIEKLER